ncbi:hypothetical protein R5R35_012618 [Gryllus longicercus]|uniref:CHHC U11-48K-type domain-containing protein n=1 Tax=Gryllus longicercus TaxID=2509291 RepID=A0AAN9VBQ1_9ORTH|nr:Gametocyte-specific factor 1 homolog [Gryllus bimaculatus]
MSQNSNEANIVEPVLVCPYNPSHQILRSRMQYHLVKCQKNHPSTEKVICPFNATHRIPRPELQYHIATCPERRIVEEQKYVTQDESVDSVDGNKPGLVPYYMPRVPPCEENWDDFHGKGYDPATLTIKKPILRNLPGATKSERKKFRLMERRRVQMLSSGEIVEDEQSDQSIISSENIRRPKWDSAMAQTLRLGMGRGTISADCRR